MSRAEQIRQDERRRAHISPPEYEIKKDPRWKMVWDVANDPRLYSMLRVWWQTYGYNPAQEALARASEPTLAGHRNLRAKHLEQDLRTFEVQVHQHARVMDNMPVGGITLEMPIHNHEAQLERLLLHITYREYEQPPITVPGSRQILEYGRRAGICIEVEVDPKVSPDNLVFYSINDLLLFMKRPNAFSLMCLPAA